MKLGQIAVAVALTVSASLSFAGTLTSSDNVEILAIDGVRVKKQDSYQLENGQHQVVARVSSLVGEASDQNLYESAPLIVTFTGGSHDVKVVAPRLKNASEANRFNNAPSLSVESAGSPLSTKQDVLKGEGFMPNSNVSQNLANYNYAAKGAAAVPAFAAASVAPANMPYVGKVVTAQSAEGANLEEQQLQYWFKKADKATQKRFIEWAKKQ